MKLMLSEVASQITFEYCSSNYSLKFITHAKSVSSDFLFVRSNNLILIN